MTKARKKLNNAIINKINNIYGKDCMFGRFCQEAENSYRNENYFAAISCLFLIAEQITKYCLYKHDGEFKNCLEEAKRKGIINRAEFLLLDNLRVLRNKLFHESHYTLGIMTEGTFFFANEDETRKMIYERFANNLFKIVLKIIKNS